MDLEKLKERLDALEHREFAIEMHDFLDDVDRRELDRIRDEKLSIKLQIKAMEG